jgi:hypothetical protein
VVIVGVVIDTLVGDLKARFAGMVLGSLLWTFRVH